MLKTNKAIFTTKKITGMKKFYLFVLLLVSAISTNAQTFDEADLVGTWTTTGLDYAPLGITNIESITLGDGLYGDIDDIDDYKFYACGIINLTKKNPNYALYDDDEEFTDIKAILDYFITNNNKLHIIVDEDYTLHFIIEELTATTLKVKTYGGKSYTFTKDNSSNAVQSVNMTRPADESTYNLSGQEVENITADGIYIQNGQKKVVKK